MAEIYRDSINKAVTLDIPQAEDVSADAYVDGSSEPIQLSISFVDNEKWLARIPYSITSRDCSFFVRWSYMVESGDYVRDEYHQVVTPYLTVSDIDHDLEFLVRKIIDAYTGNSFGLKRKTVAVKSNGGSMLMLDSVLNRIVSLRNGDFSYSVNNLSLTDGGRGIELFFDDSDPVSAPDEYVTDQGEVIVPPGARYYFPEGYVYFIDGDWGYPQVPNEVQSAAQLLYNDYKCMDAVYRNKYISEVKNANGSLKFLPMAFEGTGNLTADVLLESYRLSRLDIV